MKQTAPMSAHPRRNVTILLSVLFVLLSGPTKLVTAESVAEDLVIDNIEECLDCTESNCLYCESQHEFTPKGKHFSMCYCPLSKNGSLEIVPGYCGTVFAHFNRYAQTERFCILPPTTSSSTTGSTSTTTTETGTTETAAATDGTATTPSQETTTTSTSGEQVQEQQQQQESQVQSKSSSISATTMVIILIGLLPLVCCLGVCTGCGLFYYFYHLKKDLDEERRLQECTAMMKVVTARDLDHDDGDYSSSNTTAHTILIDVEEMEQQQQQHQQQQLDAKDEEEQELKEHHVIT